MQYIHLLPRLLPDFYCETLEEAFDEAARRRATRTLDDAVTRWEKSPYGGYRVITVPLESLADFIAYPGDPDESVAAFLAPNKAAYR